MECEEVEVVVVGAGSSGLYCAHKLISQNVNVIVLEARDRVGGRTFGKEFRGYRWDIGGQWVGPGQDRTYALYQKGKKVLEYFGKTKKYNGTIPPLNILSLIELQIHISWLESWALKLPLSRWYDETIASWDAMSVQGYMDKYIWSSAAKNLFHIGVVAVFSCEPREVSMLFFLHYCRCAGSFMKLLDVVNGAQQDRVKGGLYELSLCMAKELGERVRLNHPVRTIVKRDGFVFVHTPNKVFKAKYVAVAVPPVSILYNHNKILCDKIEFEPALPMQRQHLHQRMPMGQVIKFVIFYEQPFWRTAGFCGEITSTRESVAVIFDACVDENYALVGFFEGDAARIWSEKTEQERKAEVADLVYKAFQNESALRPIGYLEQDWQREKWSLGGYTGVFQPGTMTALGHTLDIPCWDDVLHWAGTETSFSWPGYVEGALSAGERCAKDVVTLMQGGALNKEKAPIHSQKSSRNYGIPYPLLCVGILLLVIVVIYRF